MLAEAAESVATPQIRNAGTLAGNVCQRPWCWYFRNGFPVLQGGRQPVLLGHRREPVPRHLRRRPELHRASVGHRAGAGGAGREVPHRGPVGRAHAVGADFFVLPKQNAARENVLADDEVLASVELPAARPGTRSTYHKVLDREAWTHAVVSAAIVLEMDKDVCRSARIVLGGVAPIPWRVPDAERLLAGQRITPELAAKAGEAAVAGANSAAQEHIQGAADEGGGRAHRSGARNSRVSRLNKSRASDNEGMSSGETRVEHVSDTALITAVGRALETARADGIVRDPFAEKLAGGRGAALAHILASQEWMGIAVGLRCRVIDEMLTEAIATYGIRVAVLLGAGLDTRPWRLDLPPELRWIEVDFQGILDYKAQLLASEKPRCRLERMAADLTDAAERQAVFAAAGNQPGLILTEGLLLYLPASVTERAGH